MKGLLPDGCQEEVADEQRTVRGRMVVSEGPKEPEFTKEELDREVTQIIH